MNLLLRAAKKIMLYFGYSVIPSGGGFLDAKKIIKTSSAQGLSVCVYLEESNTGFIGKRRDLICNLIRKNSPKSTNGTILEIGSGTCMFLEELAKLDKPEAIVIYETNKDWREYGLKICKELAPKSVAPVPDGRSLREMASSSITRLYAHGVFVYTSMLRTYGYIKEAARVLEPGGVFIFDVFIADELIAKTLDEFKNYNPTHFEFPVFFHASRIESICESCGLRTINSFDAPYHGISTRYHILVKD